jgi:hypothetical protein
MTQDLHGVRRDVGLWREDCRMSQLKAPFPWAGGKSTVADIVWARLGDAPNYVEPFAGSMAFDVRTEKRGWFCELADPSCGGCYARALNISRRGFGNGLDFVPENAHE